MKKIFVSAILASVISSSAIATESINIKNGWTMRGSIDGVTSDKLSGYFGDSSKVKIVWMWDDSTSTGSWKAYSNDSAIKNQISSPLQLQSIPAGYGFWILGQNITDVYTLDGTYTPPANTPPTLTTATTTHLVPVYGSIMEKSIAADFSDTDALTFSFVGSYPSWLTISASGVITTASGQTVPTTTGVTYEVSVKATDTAGNTVQKTYIVEPNNVTLNVPTNTIYAGQTSTFSINYLPTNATVKWYINDPYMSGTPISTSASLDYTFGSAGTTNVIAEITDGLYKYTRKKILTVSSAYVPSTIYLNGSSNLKLATNYQLSLDLKSMFHSSTGTIASVVKNGTDTTPCNLSVVNSALTGTCSNASAQGVLNVTVADSNGGSSNQQLNLSFVQDSSQSPAIVYGTDTVSAFSFPTQATVFDVWDGDLGYTLISRNGTAGTASDRKFNGTAFVNDGTSMSYTATVDNTNKKLTVSADQFGSMEFLVQSFKPVNSVNGVDTTGLKEISGTKTQKTTSSDANLQWDTASWAVTYANGSNTPTPVTDLTTLLSLYLNSNWWISDDSNTKYMLTGTGSSGNVVNTIWSGLYYEQCGSSDCKQITKGTTTVGSWTLTSDQLTITVNNKYAEYYKVESGVLKHASKTLAGSTSSFKWYTGVDQTTFESTLGAIFSAFSSN